MRAWTVKSFGLLLWAIDNPLLEVLREPARCFGLREGLEGGPADERGPVVPVRLEGPVETGEGGELPLEFDGAPRVVDGGLDLAAVAHDPRVLEQSVDVPRLETRDLSDVETREGCAEVLSGIRS